MNFQVTRPAYNKLSKGKAINVSHGALQNMSMTGGSIPIRIGENHIAKLQKAFKQNKGVRLTNEMVSNMDGGSILGSISSAFKSAGNAIKNTANKAGDAIKKSATQTGDAIKKSANQTGRAIEQTSNKVGLTKLLYQTGDTVKKVSNMVVEDLKKNSGARMEEIARYIPQEYVTTALTAAIRAPLLIAVGEPSASQIASSSAALVTDAAYSHNFEQAWTSEANKNSLIMSLENSARNAVNNAIHTGIDSAATSIVQGGIKSDNARRHAAASDQAKMMGLGFMSAIKKGVSTATKVGKKVGKSEMGKQFGSIAKDMAHEEIANKHMEYADRYGDSRLGSALVNTSADIAHRKVEGRGFLSIAKKVGSAAKKGVKKASKSSIAKEFGSVATPILKDMAHEEIANKHMEYADRYGDSRLGSALVNTSAEIAHRRVAEGRGLSGRGLSTGNGLVGRGVNDIPVGDTRGINMLVNFQSMGLRDKPIAIEEYEEDKSLSGRGFMPNKVVSVFGKGLSGKGLKGEGLKGEGLKGEGLKGGSIRPARFVKGSPEAKAHMAAIRAKKNK